MSTFWRGKVSRVSRTTVLAFLGGVALAAIAIGVLTEGSSPGSAAPRQAVPFSLSKLGAPGQRVSLAADSGRPVIVNFFASWCHACKKETPLLAGFYRAHHGQVLVIGVDSSDQSAAALAFVHAHAVGYPVAFDPSASVTLSYGVAALPQTFFLNARHQIVRHVIGAVTGRELASWAASLPGQRKQRAS